MKLLYTRQALNSLQECLDSLPPEVSIEKRLEIKDRILVKADMLLSNPRMGQKERILNILVRITVESLKVITKLFIGSKVKLSTLQMYSTAGKILLK